MQQLRFNHKMLVLVENLGSIAFRIKIVLVSEILIPFVVGIINTIKMYLLSIEENLKF